MPVRKRWPTRTTRSDAPATAVRGRVGELGQRRDAEREVAHRRPRQRDDRLAALEPGTMRVPTPSSTGVRRSYQRAKARARRLDERATTTAARKAPPATASRGSRPKT